MKLSRRELPLLLPALAAAQSSDRAEMLRSAALRFEEMPARRSGSITARQILKGATHSGFPIDLHQSELPAGESPHPPHRHIHEEMMLIREGVLDVSIDGRITRLGPGSVAYIASNRQHGWRNPGSEPARYFVLALGEDRG